jgi:hypothetical protein
MTGFGCLEWRLRSMGPKGPLAPEVLHHRPETMASPTSGDLDATLPIVLPRHAVKRET